MTSYTRSNAWNNGGTFDNPDLIWYAMGVGALQSRALDDQNSWWFFAAIHGEYLNESDFPGWGSIEGPPDVPTTPEPSTSVKRTFWNQCQHQSWYFAPWHRGYLIALEAQIRQAIVALEGPATWALPYWDYLGPGDQYKIPPAFTQETLPNGDPNPLYVFARYGPFNNGDIFVRIPPVSDLCETNTIYTGSDPNTRPPGFGGPDTGFSHSGEMSGNLERNPHNNVHGMVGGNAPDGQTWGLMSDPGIAALDPIFYLHHCNIDRMWAAWNENGNGNPDDPNWLNGPAAQGEREFVMPMPGNTSWTYTPEMVNSLSQVDYTYEDLTIATPVQPFSAFNSRLARLGVKPPMGMSGGVEKDMVTSDEMELVGSRDKRLKIDSSGARAVVKLDAGARSQVFSSIAKASTDNLPDQVYLKLENVRGNRDSYQLDVSVNQKNAGSISLFGLRRASMKDGDHGGQGLSFIMDITDIVDELVLNENVDPSSLDVRIVPNQALAESTDLSVGRVSVYRQGRT